MITWAKEVKQTAKLKWNGVYNFETKISLKVESGSYIIKTAETYEEIIECCRLRHKIFFQEKSNFLTEGIDVDKFDSHFDHLIIIHKATSKIIGTYRLAIFDPNKSYSATEFDLSIIEKMPGIHLELGRACVDIKHRTGTVISLLWKGIIEYMNISGASTLFGCSSLQIESDLEAAMVYLYFNKSDSDLSGLTSAKKAFKMPQFHSAIKAMSLRWNDVMKDEIEKKIPTLLKSYVKMGAQIISEPAFDKKFNCVDVLTILKKEDMISSLARRYQVVQ